MFSRTALLAFRAGTLAVFKMWRAGWLYFASTNLVRKRGARPGYQAGLACSKLHPQTLTEPVGSRQEFGHGMLDADEAVRAR